MFGTNGEKKRKLSRNEMMYEGNMVQKLNHPNVIALLHLLEEEGEIVLIFQLLKHSLLHEIESDQYAYNPERAKKLMIMMLSGLKHLHDHDIVHRDLKPQNVLVDFDGTAKIADLGISKVIIGKSQMKSDCGTKPYKAPEMCLRIAYGKPVDIWVN